MRWLDRCLFSFSGLFSGGESLTFRNLIIAGIGILMEASWWIHLVGVDLSFDTKRDYFVFPIILAPIITDEERRQRKWPRSCITSPWLLLELARLMMAAFALLCYAILIAACCIKGTHFDRTHIITQLERKKKERERGHTRNWPGTYPGRRTTPCQVRVGHVRCYGNIVLFFFNSARKQ